MKYLHTMVRVTDLDASLKFYRDLLELKEEPPNGKRQGALHPRLPRPEGQEDAPIELTYNWDPEVYTGGRNFGHLAYEVDDIYAFCQKVMDAGVTVNRPPRDGHMAFIRSPDNISLEILQKGERCPPRSPGRRCRTPANGSRRERGRIVAGGSARDRSLRSSPVIGRRSYSDTRGKAPNPVSLRSSKKTCAAFPSGPISNVAGTGTSGASS